MKKTTKIVSTLAILVLLVVTIVSYAIQPIPIKPSTENYSSFNTQNLGNISTSSNIKNSSIGIGMFSDRADLNFTISSTLTHFANNRSANLSNWYYFGALTMIFSVYVTVSNLSIGDPLTSMSFFLSHLSLQSNNSTLLFPMNSMNIPPNNEIGLTKIAGKRISPITGYWLTSELHTFNVVHLSGPVKFWFNATINPVIDLGPYYLTGSPVPVSFTWTDYF